MDKSMTKRAHLFCFKWLLYMGLLFIGHILIMHHPVCAASPKMPDINPSDLHMPHLLIKQQLASVTIADKQSLLGHTIPYRSTTKKIQSYIQNRNTDLPILYNFQVDSALVLQQLMSTLYQTHLTAPNVSVITLPANLHTLTIEQKKSAFIQALLPLILYNNALIKAHRQRIEKIKFKQHLAPDEKQFLNIMIQHYRLADTADIKLSTYSDTLNALLLRTNIIPPSIALAQAAIESGWGTSRFCKEANNLFGQRVVAKHTTGLTAREKPNSWFQLAIFPTIGGSIQSYMHNLNTHWAYKNFRNLRQKMHAQAKHYNPEQLTTTLEGYSTEGILYVQKLLRIIKQNQLTRFDHWSLYKAESPESLP